MLPPLPIYSRDFGASGLMIGVIMASFSAMQFLFSRRRGGGCPIALACRRWSCFRSTAGAAASYVVFAIGFEFDWNHRFAGVVGVRWMLAGICGANITVAQACLADVTPAAERSKKMGLIAMAFGLGFIFDRPWLASVSNGSATQGPGWQASVLCAGNFILALAILPESWKPTSEHVAPRPHFEHRAHTLSQPAVGFLIVVFFLAIFCFACFETTLGL